MLVFSFVCRLGAGTENQPQAAASYPGSPRDPAIVFIGSVPLPEGKQRHDRTSGTTPHNQHGAAPSANGSAPPPPAASQPGRLHTRISGLRTGLIAGFAILIVVVIFIIQNTHAVNISFLGAHLHLSLAVALLLAAIAGALLMAAAGTARITQLRRIMRRDPRKHKQAEQPRWPPRAHN